MNKKEILKQKRDSILHKIARTPEGKALLEKRDKSLVEHSTKDAYIEALKQVNWLIGNVGAHFSDLESKSNERIAEISKSFVAEIAKVEKGLKQIADGGDTKEMLVELRDARKALNALVSKEVPAPVVRVDAPIVNVPAPEVKVLDHTKTEIVHETKYQEEASKTLKDVMVVLERVAKNTTGRQIVHIENRSLAEAIPVQLVSKRGKSIWDFEEMPKFMGAASGGINAEYADGEALTKKIVGSAVVWKDTSAMRVVTTSKPLPVQIVIASTEATYSAPAAASIGVASTQVVAANASRKGLYLVNTSSWPISLALNDGTPVLYSGITIFPQGSWEMPESGPYFTTGKINAIAGAAASNLGVQETT